MLTLSALAADALGDFLAQDFLKTFGSKEQELAHRVATAARLVLERIGNSDALYHNVEHTMLVTLAGRDLIRGRMLFEPVSPLDWAHFIVACLAHDIGYVRGLLKEDTAEEYVADTMGNKVRLPRAASDAALTPYHVDRSKIFVHERLGENRVFDSDRIAAAIEFTRFPVTGASASNVAETLGCASPADLVDRYPDFFWRSVSPHIGAAVQYLKITAEGRTWLAHLNSNVFSAAGVTISEL